MSSNKSSYCRLHLDNGDRLVSTSDGLAEAINPDGELFGFSPVREMVHSSKSAVKLADTVQSFGQRDDISIIALAQTAPGLAMAGVGRTDNLEA